MMSEWENPDDSMMQIIDPMLKNDVAFPSILVSWMCVNGADFVVDGLLVLHALVHCTIASPSARMGEPIEC